MVSSGTWANSSLAQVQSGHFTVSYDAIPSNVQMDAVSGLSSSDAEAYTDLAAAIRFNSNGFIDARNGSDFAPSIIPYQPRLTYHFTLDVDISRHTYNAYVTLGSAQSTLGTNLNFRTEQSAVTSLGNVGVLSFEGVLAICNVTLGSATVPPSSSQLASNTGKVNFGSVQVSSSSGQNVTLTNQGTADVTISQVAVAGAGFNASGSATGLTLAPNHSTTVQTTFSPSTTGTVSGSLTVTSNAANSPATIALTGTGVTQAPKTHSISLSWIPVGAGVAGYNVYVSEISGGPYLMVNAGLLTNASYVATDILSGQTYYFVVTSVNSAYQESGYSSQVAVAVP